MATAESEIIIAIIRESISLFVLLVFIILSYRLVDKFGTEFLEVLQQISDNVGEMNQK